jgi:hypothetical protein
MDTGSKIGADGVNGNPEVSTPMAYEPPTVVALGNVHELLAGTGSKTLDAFPACNANGTVDSDPLC